jgi:cytochrome c peroxidase
MSQLARSETLGEGGAPQEVGHPEPLRVAPSRHPTLKSFVSTASLALVLSCVDCATRSGATRIDVVPQRGPHNGVAATAAGRGTGPIVTDAAMQALRALSPAQLPGPPADVSNRYADVAAAAALGQRLFFDRGFAGRLLDSDNNGGAGTLGKDGDAGRIACSDCHEPHSGFVDRRSPRQQVSLGAAWGRRRAPSLLNVAQARLLMWDGRRDTAFNQVLAALESGVELNSSRLYVAQQIYARYRDSYNAVFKDHPIDVPLGDAKRFPQLGGASTGCRKLTLDKNGIASTSDCHGMPGDRAEFDRLTAADQDAVTRIAVNVGKAIGAYLRLLGCGPGRFDAWMHGRADALDASEQRGAALFVGQRDGGRMVAGCNGCHSGPYLSDQRFHNVGLQPAGVGIAASFYDRDDHGALEGLAGALADPLNVRGVYSDGDDARLPRELPPDMDGAFRTPSLRCVALRPTFMHNGQLASLEDVIAFFDRGGDRTGYHGKSELAPLQLSNDERADLAAFLHALDGPTPPLALLSAPAAASAASR